MRTIIVDGVEFVEVQKVGTIVLVRTYSAGVHFGTLLEHEGQKVVLADARRLWSWMGACSLSQVAIDGVDVGASRISVKVPLITLLGVIEIIPMSPHAGTVLMGAKEWKK